MSNTFSAYYKVRNFKCAEMDIDSLLKKYADGQCSVEEERSIKKWLTHHIADPAYNAVFEKLLETTPVNTDKVRISNSWRRLERRIDCENEEQKSDRKKRWGFRFFAACMAIAACAVVVFVSKSGRSKNIEWKELYTDRGATAEMTLSDGTTLWLNSGTKVIYPTAFEGDNRTIFIDGEVYADVSPDSAKPFVVSTSKVNVKVHGTQFSVKSFAESENIEVVLISGSVTVESNENNGFSRTLSPGELIRYNPKFGTVEEYEINPETYGRWQNNHNLRFINQSLKDIAKELERHFDVEILIEDMTLATTQYYASFINNESLEKILQALNSNATMKISKRHDTIVISPNN